MARLVRVYGVVYGVYGLGDRHLLHLKAVDGV